MKNPQLFYSFPGINTVPPLGLLNSAFVLCEKKVASLNFTYYDSKLQSEGQKSVFGFEIHMQPPNYPSSCHKRPSY